MKALSRKSVAWIVTGLGIILYTACRVISYSPTPIEAQIFILVPLAALLVGGLIAIRLPGNLYGWLWLLLGWGFGVFQPWGKLLAIQALAASPPRTALAGLAVGIAEVGWLLALSMTSMTILLYPTGRLPSPRWRFLVWIVALAGLLNAMFSWAVPTVGGTGITGLEHPFAIQGQIGQIAGVISLGSVFILFTSVLLATLSLVFRYRRAAGLERAQLRWLAYAAVLNIAFFIIDTSELHKAWIAEETMTAISNTLLLLLPLTVAIAILRYRLYDIDLIIRKTLVYGILTTTLALVFFGGVALLQQVVGRLSGTEDSPVVIVISTLLIAALFSPLRRRIQDFIDLRFYRRKYNAEQVLAEFAAKAQVETDIEHLSADLLAAVEEAMQPRSASIWMQVSARGQARTDRRVAE